MFETHPPACASTTLLVWPVLLQVLHSTKMICITDLIGSHGFMEDGIWSQQCMLNVLPTVDLSLKGAAASDVSLGAVLSASTGATTVTASVALILVWQRLPL